MKVGNRFKNGDWVKVIIPSNGLELGSVWQVDQYTIDEDEHYISLVDHPSCENPFEDGWMIKRFELVENFTSSEEHVAVAEGSKEEVNKALGISQYTGGSSNYYRVTVKNPTTLSEPYEAECADIIEALKLDFAEGNILKALWRRAVARNEGIKKKGYDNGKYDADKIKWFAEIIANRYIS